MKTSVALGTSAKPRLHQKLMLVAVGLMLALVLVEASLQVLAFVYRTTRSGVRGSTAESGPDEIYRILCLGESTTAPFLGVPPYPVFLQRKLTAADFGRRFHVINAGLPAAHTSKLLERLPELLEEHDPQMVVVMMGINDHLYFDEPARSGLPMDAQLFLFRFRTYRLFRILRQQLATRAKAHPPTPIDTEHLERFEHLARELIGSWMRSRPDRKIEQAMRDLIHMAREPQVAAVEGDTLVGIPAPYLDLYQKAHGSLADIYVESGREQEAIALLRDAIRRHPQAEYFHRKLAGLYQELHEPELAKHYVRSAQEIERHSVLSLTRENYRAIQALLRNRGIRMVAMQYPMRSVATLRYILYGSDDVIYVDNEAVFRDEVARLGFDALFRDRFAGDFGHCTKRGNELIAENLMSTAFEPLFGR